MTAGYVIDKTKGNTGGLGGVYGICHAIGQPMPVPGTLDAKLYSMTGGVARWSSTTALWLFNVATLAYIALRPSPVETSVPAPPPPAPVAAAAPAPAEEKKEVAAAEAEAEAEVEEEEEEEEEE